jgi:hypothetical protein
MVVHERHSDQIGEKRGFNEDAPADIAGAMPAFATL